MRGIIPILAMPYQDDETIDTAGLLREIDFVIQQGVHGVGFGFASEIPRLTDAERDAAYSAAAEHIAGRVPLMVGAGANSTRAAVARARAARQAGADVLMVTPPAVPQATPDDLVAYYSAVGEATDLPVVVQDAPTMTGVVMSVDLLARLAREVRQVVAVKLEAMPPAPKVGALKAVIGDRVTVLGGAGGLDFWHELARGADGTVPGTATPELFVRIWELHTAGRTEEARALHTRLLPYLLLGHRSGDTYLYVQKEGLRRRGVLRSVALRSPCEHPDAQFWRELRALLDDLVDLVPDFAG